MPVHHSAFAHAGFFFFFLTNLVYDIVGGWRESLYIKWQSCYCQIPEIPMALAGKALTLIDRGESCNPAESVCMIDLHQD